MFDGVQLIKLDNMKATLQLNLSDALNADELRELTAIAEAEDKTIERVLFEAAQDRAAQRRAMIATRQPAVVAA